MNLYYVYSIQSVNNPNRYYIGSTDNISIRLQKHNSGKSSYTSKFKPWQLMFFIAFPDKQHALRFEKYLKSGSGRAFIKKHF